MPVNEALRAVESSCPLNNIHVTRPMLLESLQDVFGDVSTLQKRLGSQTHGLDLRKKTYSFLLLLYA